MRYKYSDIVLYYLQLELAFGIQKNVEIAKASKSAILDLLNIYESRKNK